MLFESLKKTYICTGIIYLFLIILLITVSPGHIFADTVSLKNGTLLVGKVTNLNEQEFIFRNYFGVFKVQRGEIKDMYITNDYKEDIAIFKKLGIEYNEEDIKKNYQAGLETSEDPYLETLDVLRSWKEAQKKDLNRFYYYAGWNSFRFSLSGTYMVVNGELGSVFQKGFSTIAAVDKGLDFIAGNSRHFWMPGFRFEAAFHYYQGDSAGFQGFSCSGGPVWIMPPFKKGWGNAVVSLLPGASFLSIEDNDYVSQSSTFSFNALAGYEYYIKGFTVFVHGRYMYIYDKDVSLNGLGAAIGVSYTL
ncbi:MAG: hypothetical protein GY754_04585 [bacterium]|nr:hypothetical protein [bacterium]